MTPVHDELLAETAEPGLFLPSAKYRDVHKHHRRVFIGPMPQQVVEHKENLSPSMSQPLHYFIDNSSEDALRESYIEPAIDDHTHRYFLRHGGQEDDWGEEQQSSTRREMLDKWRNSEWGQALQRLKRKERAPTPWVGSSFEIGDFVGVNILDGDSARSRSPSDSNSETRADSAVVHSLVRPSALTADTGDSFHTARTEPSVPDRSLTTSMAHFPPSPTLDEEPAAASRSSSTAFLVSPLSTQQADAGPSRLGLAPLERSLSRAQSDGTVTTKGKRAVRVHIVEPIKEDIVSPEDVLERTGSDIEGTSAAATALDTSNTPRPILQQPAPMESPEENIIMRDRMLVRLSLTKDTSVGAGFDEEANRVAQHMESFDWREFMVVWRPGRIELYDDYSIPFKELLVGHKHFVYGIPLCTAKLTLYSFTDLSFCIACHTETSRIGARTHIPFFRVNSTSLYVFKLKTRTRAIDWVWHLWRQLGGQMPPYVEVRSPVLDISLKIDVPPLDEEADIAIFRKDNLIKLCKRSLSSISDWNYILKNRLSNGAKLGLAWRADTRLDWIWWNDDVKNEARNWAVLSGLALSQPGKSAQLEVRVGEHYPSVIHLPDGVRLHEPQPVEGYLHRIKPRTHQSQEVYLTVHDGLLLMNSLTHAQAPDPPGTTPAPTDGTQGDYYDRLRSLEVRRGARQIASAQGMLDLRAVLTIRRAFHLVPIAHEAIATPPAVYDDRSPEPVDREANDDEDAGGDEGLKHSGGDRGNVRMRRCFELVMKSGQIVRFEAYSAKYAIEWIGHLRALVRYWHLRHLADARLEMDVVRFTTGKQLVTPRSHAHECDDHIPPEPLTQPDAVLPYLSSLYHWCVFESCRPVVKTGRIYVRSGYKGKYRLVHLFLTDGHLVQFNIVHHTAIHSRRGEVVNLIDAYTISGFLAAQALPPDEYQPNAPSTARRYRDGLESNDRDEDTLFIVLYYRHTFEAGMGAGRAAVPSLSADRKMLVCRARSKVERDLWCWAINTEVEKVARSQKSREEAMRTAGAVRKWEESDGPIREEYEHRGSSNTSDTSSGLVQ